MISIYAKIHCTIYKDQLHTAGTNSFNKAVCVRSIKGNRTPVTYVRLKLISGRYLGLT